MRPVPLSKGVLFALVLLAPADPAGSRGADATPRRGRSAGRPVAQLAPPQRPVFEPNLGQAAEPVRYVVRQPGATIFLTDAEIVAVLPQDARNGGRVLAGLQCDAEEEAAIGVIRIGIEGARARRTAPGPALGSVSHYFLGADPRRWIAHVPHESSATWVDALPGIDVRFHGDRGPLEFDLLVDAQALSRPISLRVEGAESVAVNAAGDLALRIGMRELVLARPVAWQEAGPARVPVACAYVLQGPGRVGLRLAGLTAGLPLVIDPTLAFSTYIGGAEEEWATGLGVDAGGSVFLSGATRSLDFPIVSGLQPVHAGSLDAFVTKLSPEGALEWSTFIGGTFNDVGSCLALDALGRPYLTGETGSPDFPTLAAVQPLHAGGPDDAFVLGLTPAGDALTFATYLGGEATDGGHDLEVDAGGAIHVAAYTDSGTLPLAGVAPLGPRGGIDMLVAKLAPGGTALLYCTTAGGSESDWGWGIAVNGAGEVLVAGPSHSADFPQLDPVQPGFGGVIDIALVRLDAAGTTWLQATQLGGSSLDFARGVAYDAAGNAVIAGLTESPDFPVVAPLQASLAGASDMTLTVLDPAGDIVRSTFLGGTSADTCFDLALRPSGAAVLVGHASGPGVLEIDGLGLSTLGGARDAIVAEVDPAGTAVTFATAFGGSGDDEGRAVALAPSGDIVILGHTSSIDLPVINAAQPVSGGNEDAFVARISRCGGGTPLDLDQDGRDDRCTDWRNHGEYVSSVAHACQELGPPPGYVSCGDVVREAARSDIGRRTN